MTSLKIFDNLENKYGFLKYLTRNVWILSFVSLLNDICSEMLYPVMPLFLQSIGFSSVLIGILEGFTEAVGGLSKGYFGRISDASGKRLPFVKLGYAMSAVGKSMTAIFTFPLWVFSSRALDRLGKGVRTAARDAILSDEATPKTKGKVFGFHRAMDTLGATIGPAVALSFLAFFPGKYKLLFLLAFIPAFIGLMLTFIIKEKAKSPTSSKTSFRITQSFDYVKASPLAYRRLLLVLLLFALFNSSDLFLLMKIKEGGWSDNYVIGSYILYNFVYAAAAFPLGHLADKFGLKKTLIFGLILFSLVYAGFGFNSSFIGFVALFALYGMYAASTEGITKALISNVVPRSETASAIGTFTGLSSLVMMLASSVAGLIWNYVSPEGVFIFSAAGVLATVLLFINIQRDIKDHKDNLPPESEAETVD